MRWVTDLFPEANISVVNDKNETPFLLACKEGKTMMVDLFLKEFLGKFDINHKSSDSWTPLFYAAHNSHLRVVHRLVHLGVELCQKDCLGRTPLHYAARFDNLYVAKELLAMDIDIHVRDVEMLKA